MRGLFENLKMFYHPEGAAKADSRGSLEKSFRFFGLGNGVWGFKDTIGERHIGWNIKSVLQISLYFVDK